MLNKVIIIASYAIHHLVLPGLSRQHEYHCLLPRQVTHVWPLPLLITSDTQEANVATPGNQRRKGGSSD